MRKAALFLTPAVAACLFLFACEDASSGGGPQTFDPDSGVFEGGPQPVPEAQAPDADVPDAPPVAQAVTVNVSRRNAPLENALVVFHDAQGAVLTRGKTDATGKLTSSGTVPSQVTVLLGSAQYSHILTYVAVEAGDELFVTDDVEDPENTEDFGAYDVTVPTLPQAAYTFEVHSGPCYGYPTDGLGLTATLSFRPQCLRPVNAILARAYGEGTPESFAIKKGNAPPVKGVASAVTIAGPWETPDEITYTAANVPPNSFGQAIHTDVIDGQVFPTDDPAFFEGTTPHVTFRSPKGVDGRQFGLDVASDDGRIHRALFTRVVPTTTTISQDFAGALPEITAASVDPTDHVRPTLSWTTATTAAQAKGGVAFVDFQDERGIKTWEFVVPPGTASVRAPALPVEAGPWAPVATDAAAPSRFVEAPEVMFVDAEQLPSYRAFVREAGRFVPKGDAYGVRLLGAALPSNGTVKVTARLRPNLDVRP